MACINTFACIVLIYSTQLLLLLLLVLLLLFALYFYSVVKCDPCFDKY